MERSYLESSVRLVTRKRISWLLLLFITESLTGTVLRMFETELKQAVALAFFVPLLIGVVYYLVTGQIPKPFAVLR